MIVVDGDGGDEDGNGGVGCGVMSMVCSGS